MSNIIRARRSTTVPSQAYGGRFFDTLDQRSLESARVIVPLVKELVSFESVIDIGCGRGAWLRIFEEHGASKIVGLDGMYVDRSKLLISEESFFPVDLTGTIDIDDHFDLAVCLEVAEHLPEKCARPLIDALCKAAPVVLFSAAIPGQGGTNHVNEQWPGYWSALFEANGFDRLDPIRRVVFADQAVASYYKQNIYLYIHQSTVKSIERLRIERDLARSLDVQVVASNRLIPLMSVRGAAAELGRCVMRSLRRRLSL